VVRAGEVFCQVPPLAAAAPPKPTKASSLIIKPSRKQLSKIESATEMDFDDETPPAKPVRRRHSVQAEHDVTRYGLGHVFGDIGFEPWHDRRVDQTMVAVGNLETLCLEVESYRGLSAPLRRKLAMAMASHAADGKREAFLRSIPALASLVQASRRGIAEALTEVNVPTGGTFPTAPHQVGILHSGQLVLPATGERIEVGRILGDLSCAREPEPPVGGVTTTAVASGGSCVVLVLDHARFALLPEESRMSVLPLLAKYESLREKFRFLQTVLLLTNLSPWDTWALADALEEITLAEGAPVPRGARFYFVVSGWCVVKAGGELTLHHRGPTQVFGEIAGAGCSREFEMEQGGVLLALTADAAGRLPRHVLDVCRVGMDGYKALRAKELYLTKVPLSDGLDRLERHEVAAALTPKRYAAGDVILPYGFSGGAAECLYFVVRGSCQVMTSAESTAVPNPCYSTETSRRRKSSLVSTEGARGRVNSKSHLDANGEVLSPIQVSNEAGAGEVYVFGHTFGMIPALGGLSLERESAVVAREDVWLECLTREAYMGLSERIRLTLRRGMEGYHQLKLKHELLRPCPLLRGVKDEALWCLCEALETIDLGSGVEAAGQGGSPLAGVYFVLSGTVSMEASFADRNGGEGEPLATFCPSEQFGHVPEHSGVEERPHGLVFLTVGDTAIERLPAWAFWKQSPLVQRRLRQALHPHDHATLESYCRFLREMPVFEGVESRELWHLAEEFTEQYLAVGEEMLAPNRFCILTSGVLSNPEAEEEGGTFHSSDQSEEEEEESKAKAEEAASGPEGDDAWERQFGTLPGHSCRGTCHGSLSLDQELGLNPTVAAGLPSLGGAGMRVAIRPCLLLELPQQGFDRLSDAMQRIVLLAMPRYSEMQRKSRLLRSLPVFRSLEESDLRTLALACEPRHCLLGELVVTGKRLADRVVILAHGAVRVSLLNAGNAPQTQLGTVEGPSHFWNSEVVSLGRYAVDAVADSSRGCDLEELALPAMATVSDRGRKVLLAHMDRLEYEAPAMLMGLKEEELEEQGGAKRNYGEYSPADLGQASLRPAGASWR